MSSENRKLRNRLSQQAFRARQAMRIKELEERLDKEAIPDAARTSQLQDMNATLRRQLLDCHKKLCSLQISMKSLAGNTATALGIDASEDMRNSTRLCSRCRRSEDSEDSSSSPDVAYSFHNSRSALEQPEEESCNQAVAQLEAWQVADNNCNVEDSINTVHGSSQPGQKSQTIVKSKQNFPGYNQKALPPSAINLDRLEFNPPSERFDSLSKRRAGPRSNNNGSVFVPSPQFSISLPFADMGFAQYGEILDRSPCITNPSQMPLQRTNSLFSDHINAIEYFLKMRWFKQYQFNQDHFAESIQFMIAAFVLVSWRIMTSWHTYTKADIPLKELTAWRVARTPEAYEKIIPTYRPTKLQITTLHPAIIDWIPWPSLRDKLIIYHSANPCLDTLICDIGNSYVVPTDLSKLVIGLPAMIGYLSVWDLVRAISPDATNAGSNSSVPGGPFTYDADAIRDIVSDEDDVTVEDEVYFAEKPTLPAPDANTLFSTKSLAIQAFKAIGMDKGAATFRLDPEFFGRHPELYDSECDLMARGVPLRPTSHWSIPTPSELNASVVAQYKELARWTFDRNSI